MFPAIATEHANFSGFPPFPAAFSPLGDACAAVAGSKLPPPGPSPVGKHKMLWLSPPYPPHLGFCS